MSTPDQSLDPALLAETRGRVFGLCRLLLGSASEAEDATSEVFVRLQRAQTTYDRALPFSHWALASARHLCLDLLRRRKVQSRIFSDQADPDLTHPSPVGSPLGQLLATEDKARLREALSRLPARERVALVLRYYEDKDYDEMGTILGLSKPGVATLVFRAKRALREQFALLEAGGS